VGKHYSKFGKKYMSRVGKQIITIPAGVEVTFTEPTLVAKGPHGTLTRDFLDNVEIRIEGSEITVHPRRNDVKTRALWGTYAALIKNMVTGVHTPFEKKLIVEGVGFKWEVKGQELHMALGFSHPVVKPIPEELTVVAEKNNLTITGINKEKVGLFANVIRSLKKPEPYKGKGIRYSDEVIRRKQGKKS
jgi:large subunit ribosomal protein L6